MELEVSNAERADVILPLDQQVTRALRLPGTQGAEGPTTGDGRTSDRQGNLNHSSNPDRNQHRSKLDDRTEREGIDVNEAAQFSSKAVDRWANEELQA